MKTKAGRAAAEAFSLYEELAPFWGETWTGDGPFIGHCDRVEEKKDTRSGPVHWHEHPEILCGLTGEATVLCSARELPLRPGSLVIINQSELHTVFTASEARYFCLIIHADFCRENGVDLAKVRFDSAFEDAQAAACAEEVRLSMQEEGPFAALAVRAAVLALLFRLCRDHRAAPETAETSSSLDRIKEALLYMRRHYAEPLTLDDAAAVAGFSRYHFAREFHRVTGQTFVAFLNRLRCEHAASLLRAGATVTEACYACGFRELSYFSRTFRQSRGVPPSACRKADT